MEDLSAEAQERVQYTLENAFENPDLVEQLESPLELHFFAVTWNWDNATTEPLLRVIRDKRCDKGTALHLYWMGDPISFYENAGSREEVNNGVDVYDVVREVEEKLVSNYYENQNIKFDPRTAWTPGGITSNCLKQEMPSSLLEASLGVEVEDKYEFYN